VGVGGEGMDVTCCGSWRPTVGSGSASVHDRQTHTQAHTWSSRYVMIANEKLLQQVDTGRVIFMSTIYSIRALKDAKERVID